MTKSHKYAPGQILLPVWGAIMMIALIVLIANKIISSNDNTKNLMFQGIQYECNTSVDRYSSSPDDSYKVFETKYKDGDELDEKECNAFNGEPCAVFYSPSKPLYLYVALHEQYYIFEAKKGIDVQDIPVPLSTVSTSKATRFVVTV